MDGAEGFVGFGFAALAIWTWWSWYADILSVNRLTSRAGTRWLLALAFPALLISLSVVLRTTAAKDVRESTFYTVFYLVLGAGWLGGVTRLFQFLGLSVRDDVLERRNGAALIPCLGAQAAAMLCFAGGNIGEGPGACVVVPSAGVATGCLLLLWWALDLLTGETEQITVERDTAAGIRLAGLLVANGAILGAAAAGDWIPEKFVRDFAAYAWPTVVLTILAITSEKLLAGVRSRLLSCLVAAAYVGLASLYVYSWGGV